MIGPVKIGSSAHVPPSPDAYGRMHPSTTLPRSQSSTWVVRSQERSHMGCKTLRAPARSDAGCAAVMPTTT